MTDEEYEKEVARLEEMRKPGDPASPGVGGAVIGFMAGLIVIAVTRHNTEVHMQMLPALRIVAGGVIGGLCADLLVRRFLPVFGRKGLAASVTTLAAVLMMSITILTGFGAAVVNATNLAIMLICSVALGAPTGLFIREVLGMANTAVIGNARSAVMSFVNRRTHARPLSKHRVEVMSGAFPQAWREILRYNVPSWKHLSSADRTKLEQQILVFIDEKKFEGCGGLEITDEIRVTIAGLACVFTMNVDADWFPRLRSILVYPETYVPKRVHYSMSSSMQDDEDEPLLGESWSTGVVVLSWAAIVESVRAPADGHQLIFHEFAHQLDQEDGRADGVPLLMTVEEYHAWTAVMQREYARHREAVLAEQTVVIRKYGATNPAEFFAVATETFFEKPKELRANHPDVYEVLKNYYRQDPEQLSA